MSTNPFLPGTTSLVDDIDKKQIVVLRDGRKLVGTMISYDHFANIVLKDAVERIFVGNKFGEKYLGIFLIRGENVVFLGQLDPQLESELTSRLQKVPWEEIFKEYKQQQTKHTEELKKKRKALIEAGLPVESLLLGDKDSLAFFEG